MGVWASCFAEMFEFQVEAHIFGARVEAQMYGAKVAWKGERRAAAPYTLRFSGSHSTSTCMRVLVLRVSGLFISGFVRKIQDKKRKNGLTFRV